MTDTHEYDSEEVRDTYHAGAYTLLTILVIFVVGMGLALTALAYLAGKLAAL